MLPTPDQLEKLKNLDPLTRAQILDESKEYGEHCRRMDERGQKYAMITVVLLIALAAYFAYLGAFNQGAGIIIFGAGAIVGFFLRGRTTRAEQPSAAPEDRPARQPPAGPEDQPVPQTESL